MLWGFKVGLVCYDHDGKLILKKKPINDKGGFDVIKYDSQGGKVKSGKN